MAVSEAVLDKVRLGMRGMQPPKHFDKVYKDECMYSFDTPESPGGLFVNLKTFQVLCLAQIKQGRSLYIPECIARRLSSAACVDNVNVVPKHV